MRIGGLLAGALMTVVLLAGCGTAGGSSRPPRSRTTAPASPSASASVSVTPTPAPTLTPTARKTLKLGAKGDDVKALQTRLSELGYDAGKADGKYGWSTVAAVWAFQKINRIKPTSTVNAKTWVALDNPAQIGPLVADGAATRVEIDLKRQLLFLYEAGQVKLVSHISSGTGVPYCEMVEFGGKKFRQCGSAVTSTGNFKTGRRVSGWHKAPLGQLYNPIFFNGGIALHGSLSVPLYPASHGCVRLPMHIAEKLPDMLGTGVPVHVRRP